VKRVPRRSNRTVLLWVVSLMIVLSMVCSLVVTLASGRQRRAETPAPATPYIVTATPQPTATAVAPVPSPQPPAPPTN